MGGNYTTFQKVSIPVLRNISLKLMESRISIFILLANIGEPLAKLLQSEKCFRKAWAHSSKKASMAKDSWVLNMIQLSMAFHDSTIITFPIFKIFHIGNQTVYLSNTVKTKMLWFNYSCTEKFLPL